jgi:hypothetical protein
MNLNRFGLVRSALLLSVLCAFQTAAAQSYRVETASTPPPQELSSAVRDALSLQALRVVGPKGTLSEIWLRKVVPAKAGATEELGISYGQLVEGTLVGAVRFPAEVNDYRQQRVKPGVYTLRYALIPVDGNHQGVAPNRDFLLISPAAADADPATISLDVLLNLSRKSIGAGHPSVWSLPTTDSAPAALPRVKHQEDGNLWVLQFAVEMEPAGGAPSKVVLSLVIVGHAPEA